MHGLYCLSRPSEYMLPHCSPDRNTLLFAQIVRISPATAKYKAPPAEDLPQVQIPPPGVPAHAATTIALPLPAPAPTKSVSSPIAGSGGTTSSSNSLSSSGVSSSGSSSSVSAPSLSSGPSTSGSTSTLASTDSNERQQNILAQLAQYTHPTSSSKPVSDAPTSITTPFARQDAGSEQTRHSLFEESWKHQAQARAILSNLIGPNGEQLTSTDPYNTTVFVGGLSPLISEETLKTFFAPFGDIHYVGFLLFCTYNPLLMFILWVAGEGACWEALWLCAVCAQSRCRTCH